MRPVAWSSSYLFRWPFGISTVTSNCTAVVWPTVTPSTRRRVLQGGGQHRAERFDGRHGELLTVPPAPGPRGAGAPPGRRRGGGDGGRRHRLRRPRVVGRRGRSHGATAGDRRPPARARRAGERRPGARSRC